MLSKTVLCTSARRLISLKQLVTRNIGVTAACTQSATTAPAAVDPIQKLFVDKIRDYAQKSKASGGKLVDATPATEKALSDELEKLSRQYGAKSADFTKFPTFNFTDVDLEPVGVQVDIKDVETVVEQAAAEEEDDHPYYEA